MNDPYARIYYRVMDDPKFDGIRDDVRLFGSWALMLVVAEMAYPSPAFVPPQVPRSCVAKLSEAGLIDLLPGHRYHVHGLATEREKRAQPGRNAAAMRWHSARNAEPMLDENENKTSTRRDNPPTPLEGGTGPRANGTNPRAITSKAAKERAWRTQQRYLAYCRGAITEAQRTAMDAADSPLSEIPDHKAVRLQA